MNKLIPLILSLVVLAGCTSSNPPVNQQLNQSSSDNPLINLNNQNNPMLNIEPTAYAVISTNKGDMKFQLFGNQAPELTKNFIELAKQGKYSNVPFHRVMQDFMIQGGDFENQNGTGGYSYKGPGTGLADEYHPDLTHVYGAIAWAKSALPNSIGSQFYIVNSQEGAHALDGGYSVFGLIIEGQDVLDELSSTPVRAGSFGEMSTPTEELLIKSVTVQEL